MSADVQENNFILSSALKDLRPSDRNIARAMMRGDYRGEGGKNISPLRLFEIGQSGERTFDTLNNFSWLRHFSDLANHAAQRHVAHVIKIWLNSPAARPRSWSPQVTARRLISWFGNGALLLQHHDPRLRTHLLRSMHRQARWLARRRGSRIQGQTRILNCCALALYGLCLPNRMPYFIHAMARIEKEITAQILPDGGHISRNPSMHLEILFDFLLLRSALDLRGRPIPGRLQGAIDRMIPMARFFRHRDKSLALFNGACAEPPDDLDAILSEGDTKGRPFGFTPHSGYQRLQLKESLIVMDTGRAPPPAYAADAHAGCLSFEMSSGQVRMIVNCGSGAALSPEWKLASRRTAAHSTLILDDTSSARLPANLKKPSWKSLWKKEMGDIPLRAGPVYVENRRKEIANGLWLETAHDGYVRQFGLIHRRQLHLKDEGRTLWGKDTLRHSKEASLMGFLRRKRGVPYKIRFHLHPDIRAAHLHAGRSILLRLPHGEGWQMQITDGEEGLSPQIEESVYLGEEGEVRQNQQIVIAGVAEKTGDTHIEWLWTRTGERENPKRAPEGIED